MKIKGKINRYTDKAFAKHTSSAFIVASPFQMLCALEAIHEFEIEDYKFVFVLMEGWKRNDQMFAMAKHFNINYDLIWCGENEREYFDWQKNGFNINAQGKYSRVFIADYHMAYYHIIVPLYAKKGAVIAYLDDGCSTILFLKGIIKDKKPSNWRKRLNWYRNRNNAVELYRQQRVIKALQNLGIYGAESFYTIYDNVSSQKFSIYSHSLSYVASMYRRTNLTKPIILVVGTAIDSYANASGISTILMESIVWKSLAELRDKFPDDQIVYIPHGRDTDTVLKAFCDILNIKYLSLNESIETYMLSSNYSPIVIYGYGSQALYNFRQLYPSIEIHNWIVSAKSQYGADIQSKTIYNYYEQSGIINEVIWISPKNKLNYETFGSNIKSIYKLIIDKLTGYKYAKK